MVDIRDITVRCGNCNEFQTLVDFRRREGWHVYVYECDGTGCDAAVTRTLVELPAEIDEFARRDPEWERGRHEAAPPD